MGQKPEMPGFEYELLSSVLHDEASVQGIFSAYEPLLSSLGGRLKAAHFGPGRKVPVFFVLTGGTEGLALKALEEGKTKGKAFPVLLIAHPKHNSLPAAMEIAARVGQDGGRAVLVLLRGAGDAEGRAELEKALSLARTIERMRSTRIGAVGEPSDWLVASSQKAQDLAGTWGLSMESAGMELLRAEMAKALQGEAEKKLSKAFFAEAKYPGEPVRSDLNASLSIYMALKTIAKDRSWDALTLRCFDLVLTEKATGCFALSQLADEGLDAGCEGDVASIVALRWMRLLSGRPGWMANPSDLSYSGNRGTMLLAHCTVPRTIIESYGVRSHFESGLGVAVAGAIPPGPVTLVRLGGKFLEKAWVAEGELLPTRAREGLCRTQAEVGLEAEALRRLMAAPLGNHVVLGLGSHGEAARRYLEAEGLTAI
jgi:L-fucose isomerase-like protein